ncbi:14964_t:CDS:1, partial [Rhizophagus irregularis]
YNGGSVGVAAEGGGVGYDENDDSACSRVYSQGNRRDLNQKQQTKM